jgi:protein gp37
VTSIEWTDRTWNPTVGCTAVSPGCEGCYAAATAHRGLTEAHRGLTVHTEGRTEWTGEVRCLPERLDIPLRETKPARWFVDSMSDLFHPVVSDEFISQVFDVMAQAHWHTFQLLTKRPQRMAQMLSRWDDRGSGPLPNLWVGTSIESDRFMWRANHLRGTPAAVRFLSLEPLIGPVPSLDLTGIDWVIVGGESGRRARPMHPDWVREIRDRCGDAGVAFFFKQWGEWAPLIPHLLAGGDTAVPCVEIATPDGSRRGEMARAGKRTAGRRIDGRSWDQYPDTPGAGR